MKTFVVTVERKGNKVSVWGNPDGKYYLPKEFTVNDKKDLKPLRNYMKEAYHTSDTKGLADILKECFPMLWFGGYIPEE